MSKRIAILSIFASLLFLGGGLYLFKVHSYQETPVINHVSSETVQPASSSEDSRLVFGKAVQLSLPSLGRTYDVVDGTYDSTTGEWGFINDKNVYFAPMSMRPNNKEGATLLYGHAKSSVFGVLPNLKAEDKAIVKLESGQELHYALTSTKVIKPEQGAAVINNSGAPTLILQTCTGIWSQDRALYNFTLTGVEG